MSLYDSFASREYRSVFQGFQMRSWGEDDDFVFPLHQFILLENSKLKPVFSDIDAKNSFFSVDEYCATIGLGAKVIQTIQEQEQGFEFDGVLRVLKQDDGGLLAVVEIPEKTRKELSKCRTDPLSPGTRGFVHLQYFANNVAGQSAPTKLDVRLSMEFIEPFPSSPSRFLAAKLQPRQKRERRSPYDYSLGKDENKPDLEIQPDIIGDEVNDNLEDPEDSFILNASLEDRETRSFVLKRIPHVAVPGDLSGGESMKYILEQSGTPSYVDTVIRHSEFCYVFEAWQHLYVKGQQRHLKFLSAPSLEEPRIDIYDGLADKQLVESDYLQLNPSQKEVLKLGRSAPGGYVIANGGPGTGKTHFIIQAVKPFFLDTKPHRLLLTSAGNRGVDSIAQQLGEWLQSLNAETRGDSFIVRLHSIKTETNIFLRDAEAAKRQVQAEKARKAAEGSQKQNKAIADHYQTYGGGKLNDFGDDRVQNLPLALGTKMKQNLAKHPKLQAHYDAYAAGNITDSEHLKSFHRKVREYLIETLSKATAVCATVSGVGDDAVRTSFGIGGVGIRKRYAACDLIVVDEAARVSEYQWWPLLAFYDDGDRFIGKIMVGDVNQMGPSSSKDEDKSPFSDQMKLSLQERLQNRGIPVGSFDIQYRAVPQIATLYNNTCYDGRLTSDERTYVKARPLAEAIAAYNELAYGEKNSVVFFDVAGAVEEFETIHISRNQPNGGPAASRQRTLLPPKEKRIPKYCNQYIFTITRILEGLINAGFVGGRHSASIAVLTPYKLEYKRLRHVKTKMTSAYPQAANIIIETVDKVQGREYDIVIVDPVIVSKPGFLDFKRLNVMFSRARCGLYVVGCKQKWEEMFDMTSHYGKASYAYPLQCFAEELYRYRIRYPTTPNAPCPDRNEFYDPTEFIRV